MMSVTGDERSVTIWLALAEMSVTKPDGRAIIGVSSMALYSGFLGAGMVAPENAHVLTLRYQRYNFSHSVEGNRYSDNHQ